MVNVLRHKNNLDLSIVEASHTVVHRRSLNDADLFFYGVRQE